MRELSISADNVDVPFSPSFVTVYTNPAESVRVISAAENKLSEAELLVFDGSGVLTEAGGRLIAAPDNALGSPQRSLCVPPGGFAVAFAGHDGLSECKEAGLEGAVIYNSTMSVIFEMHGAFEPQSRRIVVRYDDGPRCETAQKWLFVGNSATYFNGTPIKFRGLLRAAGAEITAYYCTFGGVGLSDFAEPAGRCGKALRTALEAHRYDNVVLQDVASASFDDTAAAVEAILPLITENGAKPLLYMRPEASLARVADGARRLSEIYTVLSKRFSITVAPAALAFSDYSLRHCGARRLYADDDSHPSAAGSYLIACTWLNSFCRTASCGNNYTAGLEDAKELQRTADLTCVEYFKNIE